MIVATATTPGPNDTHAFDLLAQRADATILRCSEQREELRLTLGGRTMRLAILSGTLLDGPACLTYQLDGDADLPLRLRAVHAFDAWRRFGRIPSLPSPSAPSPKRKAMLLTTVDGLARGWSQRQIAIALFGEKAVATEWDRRSDFLKSRVRRLIAWVGDLSGDAYLDLLRR